MVLDRAGSNFLIPLAVLSWAPSSSLSGVCHHWCRRVCEGKMEPVIDSWERGMSPR